jgi:ATP-dependent Clp protease ATP-binding subunit ClpA
MPDHISTAVERVVASAAVEQRSLGHPRLGTEHLLLGLLDDAASESAGLLTAAGASLLAARHMVAEVVVAEPGADAPEDPDLTPRARRALDRAARFARQDRAPAVSDLHVLSGVLDVEGLACQVLRRLGVDLTHLRRSAAGADDRDAAASDSGDTSTVTPQTVQEGSASGVPPSCPVCRAGLDDTLTVSVVTTTDPEGRAIPVRLAHCGGCGAAIGVLP